VNRPTSALIRMRSVQEQLHQRRPDVSVDRRTSTAINDVVCITVVKQTSRLDSVWCSAINSHRSVINGFYSDISCKQCKCSECKSSGGYIGLLRYFSGVLPV